MLRPKRHVIFVMFSFVQSSFVIFINLYRFLYILWYITLSNCASIKNNWYKSYVTRARNAIGSADLWRHNCSFPSSFQNIPFSRGSRCNGAVTWEHQIFPLLSLLCRKQKYLKIQLTKVCLWYDATFVSLLFLNFDFWRSGTFF